MNSQKMTANIVSHQIVCIELKGKHKCLNQVVPIYTNKQHLILSFIVVFTQRKKKKKANIWILILKC